MSARDNDAIAVLQAKIHRIDGKRACRCDDCRAIRRVCSLARAGVEYKKRHAAFIGAQIKATLRAMDEGRVPTTYISQAAVRGEAAR